MERQPPPPVVPEDQALLRRALRTQLREQRRSLSETARAHAQQRACEAALAWPALRHAQRVGLYRAFDGEFDPAPLALKLADRGLKLYYARAHEQLGLVFVKAEHWRFRGPLPIPEGPCVSLDTQDALLVPGVGFDLSGGRLGFGGGYYDRYLARRQHPTLGLAFECQILPKVPRLAHDQTLSALATECGLRLFSRSSEDID